MSDECYGIDEYFEEEGEEERWLRWKEEGIAKAGKYPRSITMIRLFRRLFENPSHGVSHSKEDGGFFYMYGGPYHPDEELPSMFPHACNEEIRKAVNKLCCRDGEEWVRTCDY